MRTKWALYVGLILLTLGILLKYLTDLNPTPTILIFTGVLFKVYYLINKVRGGVYVPGYEIVVLLIGLTLFLTGIYIRSQGSPINPAYMMIPGITLKVVFVVLFVRKIRMKY
ncbi:hypothetical protein ACFLU5_03020 [Bacteroidota bacterium]